MDRFCMATKQKMDVEPVFSHTEGLQFWACRLQESAFRLAALREQAQFKLNNILQPRDVEKNPNYCGEVPSVVRGCALSVTLQEINSMIEAETRTLGEIIEMVDL